MRKPNLILSFACLAVLCFTACKKEYTCSCTFTYVVDGQTETESSSYLGKFRSKSLAREYCQDWEDTYINTGATSADCISLVK